MPEEIDYKKIGDATAKALLDQGGVHCISFNEEERKTIHMMHEARVETKATQSDIALSFSIGKQLGDDFKAFVKRGLKFIVVALVVLIGTSMAKTAGVFELIKALAK